jgi:hypothetical protein
MKVSKKQVDFLVQRNNILSRDVALLTSCVQLLQASLLRVVYDNQLVYSELFNGIDPELIFPPEAFKDVLVYNENSGHPLFTKAEWLVPVTVESLASSRMLEL